MKKILLFTFCASISNIFYVDAKTCSGPHHKNFVQNTVESVSKSIKKYKVKREKKKQAKGIKRKKKHLK